MHRLFICFLLFSPILISSCDSLFGDKSSTYKLILKPSPEEGGTVNPMTGNYKEGEEVTLTATANSGWRFVRWEGEWISSQNPSTITLIKNYSVIGVFEKRNYPLNITIEGQGTIQELVITSKTTEYPYQTLVELTAIPATGWDFSEWGGDLSGSQSPITIRLNNEKNVTVRFVTNPYKDAYSWWKLDGNVLDQMANSNQGSNVKAIATTDRFGNLNSAFLFNGIDSYLSLSKSFFNGNNMVSKMSYSMWISLNNYPAQGKASMLSGKEGYWRSIWLEIRPDGVVNFAGSQPSPQGYFNIATVSQTISLNKWHLINVTFDRGSLKLYVDGSLKSTTNTNYTTLDYSYLQLGNSTSTNLIGASNPVSPGLTNFFSGKIDDFAIWNRVLTSDEIKLIYNQK